MSVPTSGIRITTPTPELIRRVPQRGRGDQPAHQRQREDAVEEARMVVGEAPPDGLRHQRVDAGIARPHEEGAGGSAEPVVRRIEDEAAEQGGQRRSPTAGGRAVRAAGWPPPPAARPSGTASTAPGSAAPLWGSAPRAGSGTGAAIRRSTIRCRTGRTGAARTESRPGFGSPGAPAAGSVVSARAGKGRCSGCIPPQKSPARPPGASEFPAPCSIERPHQQGCQKAPQSVPDAAPVDGRRRRALVAGRKGIKQAHVQHAGGNAEHQEAGRPPPGGKRRRNQGQVDQRDAGQGAREHQQKRKAFPLADRPRQRRPRPRSRPPGSGSNCRRP